ncbi:hypothetical protein [Alicyclobacillus sacchari]|uniref:hypothetical protein n=1 Tax=Alicyclobacillus sacchari TaxID=392010 RepID=UPI0024E177B2|nr:hypothetical protein [Alicyclobacillus sacchari]
MMTTPRTTWLPVQLQIDSVQSSSAVNVGGQNIVYGLSAHSKSNTGFGDLGSHSVIAYNKTLLNDADAIDTPIDDRDVHVLAEHHAAPMETHVAFQGMNISSMQQNAVFLSATAGLRDGINIRRRTRPQETCMAITTRKSAMSTSTLTPMSSTPSSAMTMSRRDCSRARISATCPATTGKEGSSMLC